MTQPMVLCANPKAQYKSYEEDIRSAIHKVLESGYYILGEEVKLFESEFANYIGASYCIGVGSGTEALHLALKASGVGQGDEVITTSHTAVATVSAIELCGAKPVFADVDARYFTILPEEIEKKITSKTRAIVPVHLYGQPCRMDEIIELGKKHGIKVIEDCAQSHGAKYKGKITGSIGDVAAFSFYPTKNLGAIGDGGAVVTQDKKIYEKIKLLREYGWEKRYESKIAGWNSRLDEMQAAILRVKLRKLDESNGNRRAIAKYYEENLHGISNLILPKKMKDTEHVFHLYVIQIEKRDEIKQRLQQENINTMVHYPIPIHLQEAYQYLQATGLDNTEKIAQKILSLPMYPELAESEANLVVQALKRVMN